MIGISSLQNLTINTQSVRGISFDKHGISVDMLRLDGIHPIVSGNKIFKPKYFLTEAINSSHKQVITFGGAYSNHLAATAFVSNATELKCIGFVRGERHAKLSHTLQFCTENKMRLEFMSREEYKKISSANFSDALVKTFGAHVLIPEGGFSEKGAEGAMLICDHYNFKDYSHVCCPIGTATTFAGLIKGSNEETILGFSVLKNLDDIENRLQYLNIRSSKKYVMVSDYHFGGYAKKDALLISFINSFYEENKIPLDFVYTGKMMFGVNDLINKNYFPKGSKILCIHTGGLQGNKSLPGGTLNF